MRIVNMVGFAFFLLTPWATHGLRPPDVVLGSTVHPFAAWSASRLARRRKVPFIFEIRDLWPETLIELGALRRGSVLAWALRRLERSLCNRATLVITTMPFAHEYLSAQGIPREKVMWISNGVDTSEFEVMPDDQGVRPRPFTFMYLGALGRANRVDDLIDAFAVSSFERGARLRIIGTGPLRDSIIRRVELAGLSDRVTIEERVARTEVPQIAFQADCLVLAVRDTFLYGFGVSLNKLFEYMAAGKPIVFAGVVRGNPVLASGGGICCDPEVASISRAMLDVADTDDARLASWGQANRRFVGANFDFESLGLSFANALDLTIDPRE
jgi:glycosyltransferase involved in cell wall biosynthesis